MKRIMTRTSMKQEAKKQRTDTSELSAVQGGVVDQQAGTKQDKSTLTSRGFGHHEPTGNWVGREHCGSHPPPPPPLILLV